MSSSETLPAKRSSLALISVLFAGLAGVLGVLFVSQDAGARLGSLSSLTGPVNNVLSFVCKDATPSYQSYPDLYEATFQELTDALDAGKFTSVDLVKAYLARIDEVNTKGPTLRAVHETSPVALAEAAKLDEMRRKGKILGPLHGLPFLVKDNIDTQYEDGMNTTAGSYALVGSVVPGDAAVIRGLKKHGAIILGKAALSQWAGWRSLDTIAPGWSAFGGQTTNPYYPNGGPSGSSGGSGAAIAIGLAAGALGTDTGGSVIYPCSKHNCVGIRPTIGLVSRAGVVPISEHHDTVGPMTHTVMDAAIVLSAIAGPDQSDSYTLGQPLPVPDYVKYLKTDALKGIRLGFPTNMDSLGKLPWEHPTKPAVREAFANGLDKLRELGATVVEVELENIVDILNPRRLEYMFGADFKKNIAEYFATLKENPSGVTSLQDLIDFTLAHAELEMPLSFEGMDLFYAALNTSTTEPRYAETVEWMSRVGKGAIDGALKDNALDALVFWSPQPTFSAVAGYPQVTVPLGFLPPGTAPVELQQEQKHPIPTYDPFPGLPFGITFAGTAFSEAKLLAFAYAFEQATHHRLRKRVYYEAIPKTQILDVL